MPPGLAAGTPFTLAADGIVLDGFTVQNTADNPGIYTLPTFSGYELRFNWALAVAKEPWQQDSYAILRQNALRMLIATSPDMHTS